MKITKCFVDGRLQVNVDLNDNDLIEILKGGPGSGNWAHVGRPGHVGGSGGGGGHHKLPPGHQYHKPSGSGGSTGGAKPAESPKTEQKPQSYGLNSGTPDIAELKAKHSQLKQEYEKAQEEYKKYYSQKDEDPKLNALIRLKESEALARKDAALHKMNAYRLAAESPNGKEFLKHELDHLEKVTANRNKQREIIKEAIDAGVIKENGKINLGDLDGTPGWGKPKDVPESIQKKAQQARQEEKELHKQWSMKRQGLYYNEPEKIGKAPIKGMDSPDETPSKVAKGGADPALKDFMGQAEVTIAMKSDVLAKIANQGKMKNMWEKGAANSIGKGKGEGYKTARAKIEDRLFDSSKTDPGDRPIYGYLTHPDSKMSTGNSVGSNYGDARVVLKPEVKGRTTYTMGDSLNDSEYSAHRAGSVVNPASTSTTTKQGVDFKLNKTNVQGSSFNRDDGMELGVNYIEAQIHKGVKLQDIARVEIPKGTPLSATTRKKYEKAGVEIVELQNPLKQVYYPTSWDEHYAED